MTTLVGALIEAVLNGVVWGVALTAMVASVIRLLDGINAGTRFAMWCLTLAAIVSLPVLILWNHLPGRLGAPRDIAIDEGWATLAAIWLFGAVLMLARVGWSALRVRSLGLR